VELAVQSLFFKTRIMPPDDIFLNGYATSTLLGASPEYRANWEAHTNGTEWAVNDVEGKRGPVLMLLDIPGHVLGLLWYHPLSHTNAVLISIDSCTKSTNDGIVEQALQAIAGSLELTLGFKTKTTQTGRVEIPQQVDNMGQLGVDCFFHTVINTAVTSYAITNTVPPGNLKDVREVLTPYLNIVTSARVKAFRRELHSIVEQCLALRDQPMVEPLGATVPSGVVAGQNGIGDAAVGGASSVSQQTSFERSTTSGAGQSSLQVKSTYSRCGDNVVHVFPCSIHVDLLSHGPPSCRISLVV
jgi:hypothetical protein